VSIKLLSDGSGFPITQLRKSMSLICQTVSRPSSNRLGTNRKKLGVDEADLGRLLTVAAAAVAVVVDVDVDVDVAVAAVHEVQRPEPLGSVCAEKGWRSGSLE
jgi:hypothetical protein